MRGPVELFDAVLYRLGRSVLKLLSSEQRRRINRASLPVRGVPTLSALIPVTVEMEKDAAFNFHQDVQLDALYEFQEMDRDAFGPGHLWMPWSDFARDVVINHERDEVTGFRTLTINYVFRRPAIRYVLEGAVPPLLSERLAAWAVGRWGLV